MNPIEELRQEIRDIPEIVLEMLRGDPAPEQDVFQDAYDLLEPIESGIREIDALEFDLGDADGLAQPFPPIEIAESVDSAWPETAGFSPQPDELVADWFSPEFTNRLNGLVDLSEDSPLVRDDAAMAHSAFQADSLDAQVHESIEDSADQFPDIPTAADNDADATPSDGRLGTQDLLLAILDVVIEIRDKLLEDDTAATATGVTTPDAPSQSDSERMVRPWYPDFATSPIAAVASRIAVGLAGPGGAGP